MIDKDIVERLRACAPPVFQDWEMCNEAADEIERYRELIDRAALARLDLDAENIRLREVADAARWLTAHVPTGHIAGLTEQSKYVELKKAVAKLDQESDQ